MHLGPRFSRFALRDTLVLHSPNPRIFQDKFVSASETHSTFHADAGTKYDKDTDSTSVVP